MNMDIFILFSFCGKERMVWINKWKFSYLKHIIRRNNIYYKVKTGALVIITFFLSNLLRNERPSSILYCTEKFVFRSLYDIQKIFATGTRSLLQNIILISSISSIKYYYYILLHRYIIWNHKHCNDNKT